MVIKFQFQITAVYMCVEAGMGEISDDDIMMLRCCSNNMHQRIMDCNIYF